jgi:hypothetical protein
MTPEQELDIALNELLAQPRTDFPAEVTSHNKEDNTVVVELADGMELPDVRLRPVIKSTKGVVIWPKVGTVVQVRKMNNGSDGIFIVTAIEVPELIEGTVGDHSIKWDKDGIVINEGKHGGLAIAPEIKSQVERNSRLLEAIQAALNNWVPPVGAPDSGLTLKTLWEASGGRVLPVANMNNIENKNVTHG